MYPALKTLVCRFQFLSLIPESWFERALWRLPSASLHVAIWPWGQILLAVRKKHLLLFNPPIKTQHTAKGKQSVNVAVWLNVWEKEWGRLTYHQAIWLYSSLKFIDEENSNFGGALFQYVLIHFQLFNFSSKVEASIHVYSIPSFFLSTWYLKTLKQQLFQLMIAHCGESVHSYCWLLSLLTTKPLEWYLSRLTLMERTVFHLKRQVNLIFVCCGRDSRHG